jgi:hypothetical protein
MQNLDELRREAEETKERLRRDILSLRDILKQIAREGGERGRSIAEESLQLAETRIDEAISQAEKRFETALAAVTGCNLKYDDFVTRRLDFTDFTGVEIDCSFKVEITRSDVYRVSIWASESLQDYVNAVKSGNTLRFSLKPLSFHARPIVTIKISMPKLNKIRLGGASQGTASGFDSEESLDIHLSGNSVLDLNMKTETTRGEISGASRLTGSLMTTDTEFVLSGASRVILSGTAEKLILSAWGATNVEMGAFSVKKATVTLKGASEASANVTDTLDIDLTGGSKLVYTGNPAIHSISVTGASSLNQK